MNETPAEFDAAWTKAIIDRDVNAAVDVIHDDYALVLVHPTPATVARDEWLRTLPDYIVSDWIVQQSTWDTHGDDVAVHFQLVDMCAVVLGQPRDGLFAITDVWLRGPRGWRVWRRHSTPLTAGAIPRK